MVRFIRKGTKDLLLHMPLRQRYLAGKVVVAVGP